MTFTPPGAAAPRLSRRLVAVLGMLALAAPALAQGGPAPPPPLDTKSPAGVSFRTGAFSYHESDLAIGGGAFPQGLTLERSYLSSMNGTFATYAGIQTQGWSNNATVRFGNSMIPSYPGLEPPQGTEPYLYSIVIGTRSVGFLGGSSSPTGGFVGTYEPAAIGGEALVFTGAHTTGTFTFTDADGTVLTFNQPQTGLMLTTWVAPDGTKLDYYYGTNRRSIVSNRGYALLMEYGAVPGGTALTKACAVNLAIVYAAPLSACPAGAQTVTYSYTAGATAPLLTSATNAAGQTTTYSYNSREHLDCVKLPGQSVCQVQNVYGTCVRDPALTYDPPGLSLEDPVRSQTTATGETYTYPFPASPQCADPNSPHMGASSSMTVAGTATTTLELTSSGLPTSITDPLNRTRTMLYEGAWNVLNEVTQLQSMTLPEGNQVVYAHDARGNLIESRMKAKAGSGLADIVGTASYPASCTSPKTCNKPDYVIDARGNRTDYTYSNVHGGVLTETQPAVNGVRPQKRYTYAQRYAWIKTSGGAYAQAATPVWVLNQESICRSGAASGAGCANGSSDEVVTSYDYGPDTGPNNLLLRGIVVDSGGLSLRTCYGYDAQGNRISETKPSAGPTSCP